MLIYIGMGVVIHDTPESLTPYIAASLAHTPRRVTNKPMRTIGKGPCWLDLNNGPGLHKNKRICIDSVRTGFGRVELIRKTDLFWFLVFLVCQLVMILYSAISTAFTKKACLTYNLFNIPPKVFF